MLDIRNYALIGLGLALVAALSWGGVERTRGATARQNLADLRLESERQAVKQREANRDRAIQIEERIVTQTVYRDKFITKIEKEIQYVTLPLAACPVPPDAIRMLNAASRCVSEDRPASCGAGDEVQPAQ